MTTATFTIETLTLTQPGPYETARVGVLLPPQSLDGTYAASTHTLVYVAGMGGSMKGALPFLSTLAQQTGNPVIGIDLPGFGLNHALGVPFGPARYPEFLQQCLQSFFRARPDWPQALQVVSISLGAATVCHWAKGFQSTWPTLSSLSLLAPAFRPYRPTFPYPWVAQQALQFITSLGRAQVTMPYGITELTQNSTYRDDPHYHPRLQLPLPYLLQVEQYNLQAFHALGAIIVPTAIVIPTRDVVCCPQTMAQAYYHLPADTPKHRIVLEGAFHDVVMEAADDPQSPLTTGLLSWFSMCSAG